MCSNKNAGISLALLRWYQRHARPLPWRQDQDPYHIWVAEIMLQQTRVNTVIPYYQRWMKRFPTLAALARSTQDEVLRAWEGMGYYSRARNLYRAAQIIHDYHHAVIPRQVAELIKLPGIGRNTAGAIASMAYNQPVPILDGNIKRVLARLIEYDQPVNQTKAEAELWQSITSLLPSNKVGKFNQAMMELGQILCLPRSPQCQDCPLKRHCRSYQHKTQDQFPIHITRRDIPHYTVVAAAIWNNKHQVLISRRPEGKLMAGMWEFPGGKVEGQENLVHALKREIYEELNIKINVSDEFGCFKHAYTHFRVTVHAFHCQMKSGKVTPQEGQQVYWVQLSQLSTYPMGKVDRLISQEVCRRSGMSV